MKKIMNIGYARVSKADGSQTINLQHDALVEARVEKENIYFDKAGGRKEDRIELNSCLRSLRKGDTLFVWKLDRLGRSLKHLVNIVQTLAEKGIRLKVLTGQGATINTTTPEGKLIFAVFAALAEFEHDLIVERTKAGLAAARARGKRGGRKFALNKRQIQLAVIAMKDKKTVTTHLAKQLGVTTSTLYKYVDANGNLREHGEKAMKVSSRLKLVSK